MMARSWRWSDPRARNTARSRRRARTDAANKYAHATINKTVNTIASMSGAAVTRCRARTLVGVTSASGGLKFAAASVSAAPAGAPSRKSMRRTFSVAVGLSAA